MLRPSRKLDLHELVRVKVVGVHHLLDDAGCLPAEAAVKLGEGFFLLLSVAGGVCAAEGGEVGAGVD